MKRALISGIATLVLLLVSACADGNVASRRDGRLGATATAAADDYNFQVNNITKALLAKNPKMTLKEATAEAQQRATVEASPSSATTWADEYQRQQKAAAEDKFLADLDKSQRGD